MGTHDPEAAGIVPDRLQRQRSRVRVQCRRVDDRGIDAALVHQPDRLGRSKMRHRPMRLVAQHPHPRPQVLICASTICTRRLSVIEAKQLLRVVVQDLVSDFLRQAEPLDIGKGLPVDLPILQHRIVAAGHDVTGAERFEGA